MRVVVDGVHVHFGRAHGAIITVAVRAERAIQWLIGHLSDLVSPLNRFPREW